MKIQDKPNKNNNTSSDIPNIKSRSTWEPPKNHHTINTLIEPLNNDVDEPFKHKQTDLVITSHSMKKKSIISEFSKRKDLALAKADKGGVAVMLDVEDYLEKANKE